MKILHTQINVLLKTLFRLERSGNYETALAEVENIWGNIDDLPNISELDSFEAAEMILRCGSLIGFYGHKNQLPKTQETSKDLLTEARRRFIELENIEKIAECENYLALAYWRTAELIEAQVWVEQTLLRNLPASSSVRLYSKIIKSLLLLSDKKYAEIISTLQNEENNFLNFADDCMKGDFYNYYGLALKNLGENFKALDKFKTARLYHQKSGHQIYLGAVENNLAQLYKTERDFEKAHDAIDHSTKIFKNLKDRTREGFSLDTKAQIYFAQGKFKEALITVEVAISLMQKGKNLSYLVETYWTKTKILIYLNDVSAATQSLFEAVQIAKTHTGEEAANNLMKDFEKTLHEKNSLATDDLFVEQNRDEETFELILPPSIAHYGNVQGVRIKNTHLEKYDLPKDSLAIVVKEKIRRGDLVAITEIASDAVICGFYDADFGIVCLENGMGEPTLYDESDIKILGKIIGVCGAEKTSDGKMLVKPLIFSR